MSETLPARVPDDVAEAIHEEANLTGRTVSAHVRAILSNHVNEPEHTIVDHRRLEELEQKVEQIDKLDRKISNLRTKFTKLRVNSGGVGNTTDQTVSTISTPQMVAKGSEHVPTVGAREPEDNTPTRNY
jgi:predicted DNA-binding protein